MIPEIRELFNREFTQGAYQQLKDEMSGDLQHKIGFRIAETPVFLTPDFKNKLIDAGNDIINVILKSNFKELTQHSIPDEWHVENENDHPHFLTFDFAVCKDQKGNLVPKLIELQGFPSLYSFQAELGSCFSKHFSSASNFQPFFNNLSKQQYLELLRKTVIGNCNVEEVILLDIDAHHQKTSIDFYYTAQYLGIEIVALDELKQVGNTIFYTKNGEDKLIKRIYNRLIFDEINDKKDALMHVPDLLTTRQIEWVTHPNWFYRISKYTLPFLESEFVPKTFFLPDITSDHVDLAKFVLKPLFSFAGQGVIIDVKESDIHEVRDPENWILQEKVEYEPVIDAPGGRVKCEIRLMYLWPDGDKKPTLAINLARLSKGKMIGVRYNENFDWVGGTICLFFPEEEK